MKYIVTINDKEYEVEVEKGQAVVTGVKTAAIPAVMPVQAPAAIQAAPVSDKQAAPASAAASGEPVKAPMPGTILDVKVSAGSKVKKGSVLLILEAMKMENEIVAPCDGNISYINGARGSSINTGDLLAVIQ
jgi:biotin carboxyl carrier protein